MMEENKTIFNYIGQTFSTFGVIVALFIILGCIVGDSARDYSALALCFPGFQLTISMRGLDFCYPLQYALQQEL